MKKEDKEHLLKDLCNRLPYGVMCNIGLKHPLQLQRIFIDRLDGILLDFYEDGNDYQVYLGEVKPYLRSMTSMTEEEIVEFKWLNEKCDAMPSFRYVPIENYRIYDWMNRHHFDYRGLIEKGLALEAPKDMYKFD